MSEVSTNPFPGLRPFKFHEHELFFGREEQYEQMVGKLSEARFLAVVGTSGSGKSSLVRAGLLPALYGGQMMSAGSNWRIAVFRPKDDPIRELALALNHHRVFGSKLSENGSSILKTGDILDWSALCTRLRDEAAKSQPSPGSRILDLLPADLSKMIRESNGNSFDAGQKSTFISGFNEVLKRRDFYDSKHFERVAIKGEAGILLEGRRDNFSDSQVQNFNRLLLEAHYSVEIAKRAEIQTKITEVTLRRGDLGLVEAVRQFKTAPQENLLVVVDQFEELFRYARISENGPHGNQAAAFVKLLLEARNQKTLPIYVVLTMRSDYLGDCAKFWDLPEAINEGEYLIPRLTREQRREAIRGPVKLRGADITPQLVNQLLNDMGDSPDELPILQHALMRTWDNWSANHKDGEPIDITHYHAIGRMAQALSIHADEAYDSLPEKSRNLTEKIFRCLTEKTTGARETRRPASLKEIRKVTGAKTREIVDIINVFRRPDRSFLMPSARKPLKRGTSIDISHESLIRNWTKLKQWVDKETNDANTYRRLLETARLYKTNRAGILSALEVEDALKWRKDNSPNPAWASRYHLDLDDTKKLYANVTSEEGRKACDKKIFDEAMAFLDASRNAHFRATEEGKRQRKSQLRRLQAIAAIFLLLTIVCFILFKKAQNEERLANLLTYVENLNSVQSEFDRKNYGRAHELLNTLKVSNYQELRGFELDYLLTPSVNLLAPELSHDDSVLSIAFFPRKNLLASASADGKVRLWTPSSGKISEWQKDAWVPTELSLKEVPSSSKNPVSLVAFSPDGERFATVDSTHKSLKLWRINDEGSSAELIEESRAADRVNVLSIAFSPDGGFLASALSQNGSGPNVTINSIEMRESKFGKKLYEHTETAEGPILAMAFSPGGTTLAIGNSIGKVEIRDVETLRKKTMHDNAVSVVNLTYGDSVIKRAVGALAFSPDSRILATGRADGSIELWDTILQRQVSFPAHPDAISYLAFSSEGKNLASASHNGSVILWKTNNVLNGAFDESVRLRITNDVLNNIFDESTMLTGHAGPVLGVAFLPNTNLLATASADKTTRLWDTSIRPESSSARLSNVFDERVAFIAFTPEEETLAVAFSPNEKTLAAGRKEGDVKFLDTVTMREKALLGDVKVGYIALSSKKKLLATWKSDGSLALWDSREWKELATVAGASREVKSMAFSRNGDRLAIWSPVEGATIYDTTSKLTRSSKVVTAQQNDSSSRAGSDRGPQSLPSGGVPPALSSGDVASVAFSPDLELLAVGLENGTVKLFNTRNGQQLKPLEGHSAAVLSIAFSHDGQKLATGGADKTVKIWKRTNWNDSVTLRGHEMPVQSLAFSEDGRRLATGSWDGTVKLWDADLRNNVDLWTRLKRQELVTLRGHKNAVLSLAFSHDGLTLASADADNVVTLWKTTNHQD